MILNLNSVVANLPPLTKSMSKYLLSFLVIAMASCAPKEQVVFRRVTNVRLDAVSKTPVLKADMVFYNPNKTQSKLKTIKVDIFVNEKKGGTVDQTLNQVVKGEAEFTVPIEVQLNLKELGLMDTIINLFGGKKYSVHMLGKIRVSIHGFSFNVPVDYTEELKVKL